MPLRCTRFRGNQERREEVGLAIDIIKKKGVGDNYEGISELRFRLKDAKERNKKEYQATKTRLKRIDEVLRDSDVMIHNIETERRHDIAGIVDPAKVPEKFRERMALIKAKLKDSDLER